MFKLEPRIVPALKHYSGKQLAKDITAGIFVAIIAFPLSIALAISSGMRPEQGLYTAIVGGVIVSLLGGSNVQIGGATAATVMTVFTIIKRYGAEGLLTATVLAGILLILMGMLHLGILLQYIPYSITLGFTAGIGVGIFTGQLKEFFGLTMGPNPVSNIMRLEKCLEHIRTVNPYALGMGLLSILILLVWPKITKKIPNTLIVILITTALVKATGLPVNTVESIYGKIPSNLPVPQISGMSLSLIADVFPMALTLALLIAIVSLLSCVVTDNITGDKHNSNMELIAQGAANIFCGIFCAVPVAGAVARSSASVANGGRTPIAGIVHSICVGLILLFLVPLAGDIPMAALSAILIVVAYNMSNIKALIGIFRYAPKSDAVILTATFTTAVFVDLITAVEIGILFAALLFMKRMSDETQIEAWRYADEIETEGVRFKEVPKNIMVFQMNGPLFFAVSHKIEEVIRDTTKDVIILRMSAVPALDITALNGLKAVYNICCQHKIKLIFSHVNPQPMSVMKKNGFYDTIGAENFYENIDAALEGAKSPE